MKKRCFLQKLCVIETWQEITRRLTREQLLDLFENGEGLQEFFKASCEFVSDSLSVFFKHFKHSQGLTLDTAQIQISQDSGLIKDEKTLIWYVCLAPGYYYSSIQTTLKAPELSC